MHSFFICTLALILVSFNSQACDQQQNSSHLQIDGEWSFIKTPCDIAPPADSPGEAIILIHGNSETVNSRSSTWERLEGYSALMETLLNAGYVIAQTNHTATASNGMWGNPASQKTVLALMAYLRKTQGIKNFNAIAVSAGNATLLNLILDHKAVFKHTVLVAPVISLASLYRCPKGIDRVSGLATAFNFKPSHGCPGDPINDKAFIRATAHHDPLAKLQNMSPSAQASILSSTGWMALYNQRDPKVIPEENLLPFTRILKANGIGIAILSQKYNRHNPKGLLLTYRKEISNFINHK